MERPQGSRTAETNQDHFVLVHENDLGGCAINGDGATYYPQMWKWMVDNLDVRSVIDVGCGAGFAIDYFKDIGITGLGVEGCRPAIDQGLLSEAKGEVVHHDYKSGPYIPPGQFDLCWTCEFVEHVEEKYLANFLTTFSNSRYLALTFAQPGQGGHHHVNEQSGEYWVQKVGQIGFVLDVNMTLQLRQIAMEDCKKYSPYYESHFIKRGLFFRRAQIRS